VQFQLFYSFFIQKHIPAFAIDILHTSNSPTNSFEFINFVEC